MKDSKFILKSNIAKNLVVMLACTIFIPLYADTIPLLVRGGNRGWSMAEPKNGIPYKGTSKGLMIAVDFANKPGGQNALQPDEISRVLLGKDQAGNLGIKEFFRDNSNGKLTFNADVDNRWLRLPKPFSSSYPGSGRPAECIRDAFLAAQAKGYRMGDYDIVYIIFPEGVRHNSPLHWLSAGEMGGIEDPPLTAVTFGDDAQGHFRRMEHLVHETSHAMGLMDLYIYNYQNVPDDITTPGPWEIMCDCWNGISFSTWNLHLWDWLDDSLKKFIQERTAQVVLYPLEERRGTSMVVIPTDNYPSEVLVIENPLPWKAGINRGAFVYKIDASPRPGGGGGMDMELPPGITDTRSADALWQPGQEYIDEVSAISVRFSRGIYNRIILSIHVGTITEESGIIHTPKPGSTLKSGTVTFRWNTLSSKSYLYVGSQPGDNDYYGSSVTGRSSQTVSGLPVDGSMIHVRLWTLGSKGWKYNDYSFTAFKEVVVAEIKSPRPGSNLDSTTVTFSWDRQAQMKYFDLIVGTKGTGSGDIRSSSVFSTASMTVAGLPVDGKTLYVRLWTYTDRWRYQDVTYTALEENKEELAVIYSPAPGSTIRGGTATFRWTTISSGTWLQVGTTVGGAQLFNQNVTGRSSQTVSGLPENGWKVYVRLWSWIAGRWQYNTYTYDTTW